MATKVLDSYAMLTFFEGENGADKVRELLLKSEQKKVKLVISAIALGDVWHSIAGTLSDKKADDILNEITGMAIEVADTSWTQVRTAAEFRNRGVPYAESYSAALAKIRRGELVTNNLGFKLIENEIKINWITSEGK